MGSKKLYLGIGLSILIFAVGVASFFLHNRDKSAKYIPNNPKSLHVQGSVAKSHASVLCGGKDTVCVAEDGKVVIKKVTEKTLEYIRRTCDDPRNCPTPIPENKDAAIKAIRENTNEDDLELIPIRGEAATGITYYCAKDNRCWAVDSNTNEVLAFPE